MERVEPVTDPVLRAAAATVRAVIAYDHGSPAIVGQLLVAGAR